VQQANIEPFQLVFRQFFPGFYRGFQIPLLRFFDEGQDNKPLVVILEFLFDVLVNVVSLRLADPVGADVLISLRKLLQSGYLVSTIDGSRDCSGDRRCTED